MKKGPPPNPLPRRGDKGLPLTPSQGGGKRPPPDPLPRRGKGKNKNIGKMTIKEAQQAVDQWIKQYGVRYFSELTNMAVLTEEVGELARVIARKYGDQSFKPGEKDNLGEEMADVLWVLLCLANQTGVDLTVELNKSIEKKTRRDSRRHIDNPKLLA